MRSFGESRADLLVRARSVLLDALVALHEHRTAVIVIGAQAVYLRTGGLSVALAEATKDSDLALDTRSLSTDPLLENAMRSAGFLPTVDAQPGAWVCPDGIPVDLMVPESLAGRGSRRAPYSSPWQDDCASGAGTGSLSRGCLRNECCGP